MREGTDDDVASFFFFSTSTSTSSVSSFLLSLSLPPSLSESEIGICSYFFLAALLHGFVFLFFVLLRGLKKEG